MTTSIKLHTLRVALRSEPRPFVSFARDAPAPATAAVKQGWRAIVDDGARFVQVDHEEESEAVAQALESMAAHYRAKRTPITQQAPRGT